MTSAFCVESDDGADTAATTACTPGPGAVFHYLVRAENDCGASSVGTNSEGQERSAQACP